MSKDLYGAMLPEQKDEICMGLVQACNQTQAKELATDCDVCQATLGDVAFSLRRLRAPPSKERVYEVLSQVRQGARDRQPVLAAVKEGMIAGQSLGTCGQIDRVRVVTDLLPYLDPCPGAPPRAPLPVTLVPRCL